MKAVKKKLFVLDTNVILYDHTCINHFEEHDIVIPIVVLEELDKFKKGSDLINFEAREFIRELDKLAGDQLFTKGVSLGKGKGRLYVEVEDPHSELIYHAFAANKADHRILALADQFCKTLKGRPVIIVSKDINLRMKAKSLGIPAEDYETGKIQHVDKLYAGAQVMEDLEKSIINKFYEEPYSVALDILPKMSPPSPNQYFIFKNNSSSVLCRFNAEKKAMERVVKRQAYGIEPRNAEQTITLDALMQPEIQLVAIDREGRHRQDPAGPGGGPRSSGGSSTRSTWPGRSVPLANRDIGFLPGDIKSKIDPYMEPLWDNLAVIKHRFSPESKEHNKINDMIQNEKLVISALAFIRGRSLSNIFFIVDEAQNLTPLEVKTIITRAGEGAKIVFTGDIYQIDSPYLDSQSNGLTYLVDRMKGQQVFAHVNLLKGERSHLAELASDLL